MHKTAPQQRITQPRMKPAKVTEADDRLGRAPVTGNKVGLLSWLLMDSSLALSGPQHPNSNYKHTQDTIRVDSRSGASLCGLWRESPAARGWTHLGYDFRPGSW